MPLKGERTVDLVEAASAEIDKSIDNIITFLRESLGRFPTYEEAMSFICGPREERMRVYYGLPRHRMEIPR